MPLIFKESLKIRVNLTVFQKWSPRPPMTYAILRRICVLLKSNKCINFKNRFFSKIVMSFQDRVEQTPFIGTHLYRNRETVSWGQFSIFYSLLCLSAPHFPYWLVPTCPCHHFRDGSPRKSLLARVSLSLLCLCMCCHLTYGTLPWLWCHVNELPDTESRAGSNTRANWNQGKRGEALSFGIHSG